MIGIEGNEVDWKNMPLAIMAPGNAKDSYLTLKCFFVLWSKIKEDGQENTYNAILKPAVPIFTLIEYNGQDIDPATVDEQEKLIKTDMVETLKVLRSFKEVSEDTNLSSNKQLTQILYSCDEEGEEVEGGFHLYPPIMTDKNAPSIDKESKDILLEYIEEELNKRGVYGEKK